VIDHPGALVGHIFIHHCPGSPLLHHTGGGPQHTGALPTPLAELVAPPDPPIGRRFDRPANGKRSSWEGQLASPDFLPDLSRFHLGGTLGPGVLLGYSRSFLIPTAIAMMQIASKQEAHCV
jgi:hypothetical protein